jgi:cell division protein YceG involved in septum cleavage
MNKTTKTIVRGVVILVAIGGALFVTKMIINKVQAKNREKRQDEIDIELGNTETQQERIETDDASNYNPKADNDKIHGYIDGLNWYTYGNAINAIFNRLTDAEVKKLANYWKSKHNGESLYYWLDDELDNCYSPVNCYDAPMKRLSNLGLS